MTTEKAQPDPSESAKSSCGKPISINAIFPSSSIKVSALASTAPNPVADAPQPMPKADTSPVEAPIPRTLSRNPWQTEADRSKLIPAAGLAAAGLLVCLGVVFVSFWGGSDDAPSAQATTTQPQTQPVLAAPSQTATVPAPAPAPAPTPVNTAITEQAETTSVATNDAPTERVGPTSFVDTMMNQMTANTLAVLREGGAIETATTAPAPATPVQRTALYELLTTAVAQGQSQDYIDELVNGAHARQEITVPESLIGADGRVDTATLLAVFVGN